MLPGCVYTVAADLRLQPCRKEPLLKTNGIAFQRGWCQVLESRATFDNFTRFRIQPGRLRRRSVEGGRAGGECAPTGCHLGELVCFLGNQTLLPTGLRQPRGPSLDFPCTESLRLPPCPGLPRAILTQDLETESRFPQRVSPCFLPKTLPPPACP